MSTAFEDALCGLVFRDDAPLDEVARRALAADPRTLGVERASPRRPHRAPDALSTCVVIAGHDASVASRTRELDAFTAAARATATSSCTAVSGLHDDPSLVALHVRQHIAQAAA